VYHKKGGQVKNTGNTGIKYYNNNSYQTFLFRRFALLQLLINADGLWGTAVLDKRDS
jgi:hypothetical protein